MNESIRESLLGDRIIIREATEPFIQSIHLRLEKGIPDFFLENANIKPVYCSSINKHTCARTIDINPNTQYLIFDEHHVEMLGAMNLLFYMYGQNDIKWPIYSMMMHSILKTPGKRLKLVSAQLLSEKSMLESNYSKALMYLEVVKDNMISKDDYSGDAGRFDLNWFLLKERRAKIAHALALNFYVYHELAHIKAKYDPDIFSIYYDVAENYIENHIKPADSKMREILQNTAISVEEIACDVYALDLLFDFMMEEGGDYEYEFMVDSYISSITNLSIMDSIISHSDTEKLYIDSWIRIIISLNTLIIFKGHLQGIPDFRKSVQSQMSYCHMTYKNYRNEMLSTIYELQQQFGKVQEKHPFLSKDWKDEEKTALSILASIK